jgi:hypothetical protein
VSSLLISVKKPAPLAGFFHYAGAKQENSKSRFARIGASIKKELRMIEMKNGDVIRFKTTGYEIADVRNSNPPKEWTGIVIGGPNDTHVVLWCERERREAAPVMIALKNIICNESRTA